MKKSVCEVGPYDSEARPKGKGKVVFVLAVKEYMRSGGVASFILNFGTRWR